MWNYYDYLNVSRETFCKNFDKRSCSNPCKNIRNPLIFFAKNG